MAFDDTTKKDDFKAPNGMSMYSWIAGKDEAGYVYGEKLSKDGQTGTRKTNGDGGPSAKDALIALTIKPSGDNSPSPTPTPTPTPGNNDSGAGNPNSDTSVTAGSFTAINEGALMTNQSGYTGSGFVDMGLNGSWVEWKNINVSVAGRYRIDMWYANGKSGDRRAAVIVNGESLGNLPFSETGHFSNWFIESFTVDLNQGSNRIRIQANTDNGGPHIDGFDLFNLENNQPGGDDYTGNNWLSNDQRIYIGEQVESTNGKYRLVMQSDGNLVFYDVSNRVIWSTNTAGSDANRAVFHTGGNLTLYTATNDVIWSSGTKGYGAERIVVNDNGTLGIYAGDDLVWSKNGSTNPSPSPSPNPTPTPGNGTKIAFIGDTGAGSNFQQVLNLIKREKAVLTIVAGDTSYDDDKDDDWDAKVRNTLGSNDPALIAAGNHDYGDSKFSNVKDFAKKRLARASNVSCTGSYAEKMSCRINNVYIVMSSIGSGGSNSSHESYIKDALESAPSNAWRICAWHKNQGAMQVGGKGSSVGWTAYESCRQKGAIIATGHEHSYSRTHLLSDMSDQNIASKSSTFTVTEGKTFAFVNGLGGVGIRDQERGGSHWAKIYTSSQGATYGVLFGTFYEDRAEFYFKNIKGKIIDQFTVMKGY